MKTGFKLPEQTAIATQAETLLNTGVEQEVVLAFMRDRGLGRMDSMRVLVNATGVSLLDAKNIVLNSLAWQDAFGKDPELQKKLHNAVQALDLASAVPLAITD